MNIKTSGLVSNTIKNGKCTEYGFEDKFTNTKKRNVATLIKPLILIRGVYLMRSNSDEKYVLELLRECLNENYEWQKRFIPFPHPPEENL